MTKNTDVSPRFDSEKWTSDPHAESNFNEQSVQSIMKIEYPTIYNGYMQIMDEQFELFCKKMMSYGMDNISMGTQLDTPEDKKLSLTAIWIRCNDKMNRLKNLVLKGNPNTLDDEPIEDAYVDLVNYNIISQLVSRDLWKKG